MVQRLGDIYRNAKKKHLPQGKSEAVNSMEKSPTVFSMSKPKSEIMANPPIPEKMTLGAICDFFIWIIHWTSVLIIPFRPHTITIFHNHLTALSL